MKKGLSLALQKLKWYYTMPCTPLQVYTPGDTSTHDDVGTKPNIASLSRFASKVIMVL